MRMDRYEEDNIDASKKSRTDKNQELYTDVYLNNAYVDISEINEVVNDSEKKDISIKKKNEINPINYTYEEKKYDIRELINSAIESNNDNLKRSLEQTNEIENIIKTINENQFEKEKNENLLSDLLEDTKTETTTLFNSLNSAITDTKIVDTSILHKNEMSNEMLDEITNESPEEFELVKKNKNIEENKDEEKDNSLANETKINKKKIFIIIGIVLFIIIVLGILIYTKIIKIK